MPRRLVAPAAVAALLGVVLAGCATLELGEADPGAPDAPVASRTPALPGDAASALAALPVAERTRRDDYRRDAFGSPWRDTDGNGCNQRDDVLLRDAVPGSTVVARQGACDHDVLAGRWTDPYTGRAIELDDLKDPAQAQAVQIDHVVPLAEAWASGAARWSDARRARFANDLDGLLAVDGPTNSSKGASDPAAWRPRKSFQCDYAVRWIDTKSRWSLAVDPSEARALEEMLARCE